MPTQGPERECADGCRSSRIASDSSPMPVSAAARWSCLCPTSDRCRCRWEAQSSSWSSSPWPPPTPDEDLHVDGFLMPGVVDRHVHIGLSDPGAVLAGGVTGVRDLAWPAETIFSLAEASESPSFNGPLIRCAGPMITCTGGYPTRSSWAPKGTGVEVRGSADAAEAARNLLAGGAAVLKVALNADAGPTLSDEELLAVCEAGHGADVPVNDHCQGRGQVQRAVGRGSTSWPTPHG